MLFRSNATPAYTDGTWANGPITLTASGSTDDFTADADLVYEYSMDGSTWALGNSVVLSTGGVYQVSFKVTDEASNVSDTVVRSVKVDADGKPVIQIQNDMSQFAVKAILNVTVQDGDSGLKTLRTKIGAGDWETSTLGTDETEAVPEHSFTLMVPFTGTTAADYLVQIEVTDRAGNMETVAMTVPTIVSDTSSGTFNAPVVVRVTMSEEVDGIGFCSRYTVVNQSADIQIGRASCRERV